MYKFAYRLPFNWIKYLESLDCETQYPAISDKKSLWSQCNHAVNNADKVIENNYTGRIIKRSFVACGFENEYKRNVR